MSTWIWVGIVVWALGLASAVYAVYKAVDFDEDAAILEAVQLANEDRQP